MSVYMNYIIQGNIGRLAAHNIIHILGCQMIHAVYKVSINYTHCVRVAETQQVFTVCQSHYHEHLQTH